MLPQEYYSTSALMDSLGGWQGSWCAVSLAQYLAGSERLWPGLHRRLRWLHYAGSQSLAYSA